MLIPSKFRLPKKQFDVYKFFLYDPYIPKDIYHFKPLKQNLIYEMYEIKTALWFTI